MIYVNSRVNNDNINTINNSNNPIPYFSDFLKISI